MDFRGRRLSGLSGLMLVLGLAGLLVMHGFDVGAAAGAGDGHVITSTAQHDTAPAADGSNVNGATSGSADSDRATSTGGSGHRRAAATDAAADDVGLGHVVAMCMVVAATGVTGVHRVLRGVRATLAAAAARAAHGLATAAAEAGRSPGRGRLELCIQRC